MILNKSTLSIKNLLNYFEFLFSIQIIFFVLILKIIKIMQILSQG